MAPTHAFDWPLAHGEYDSIAATQWRDVHATLGARTLLSKGQLASDEVRLGIAEQNSHLQWKTNLVIHFLVQRIIIVRPEFDEGRRGPHLTGIMAPLDKIAVVSGVLNSKSLKVIPAIGDSREWGVERFAKAGDEIRQRVTEVLVFTAPEPVARHHDPASKELVIVVSGRQSAALGG